MANMFLKNEGGYRDLDLIQLQAMEDGLIQS
jgi:hypothetical protein